MSLSQREEPATDARHDAMRSGGTEPSATRLLLLLHINVYASLSLSCSMPVASQRSTARENLCKLTACCPMVRAARVMQGTHVSYCSCCCTSRSLRL